MSSRISNCGKAAATSDRVGGLGRAEPLSLTSVGIDAWAIRHLGQRPCGASAGMGPPHFGQYFNFSVSFIPIPEARAAQGYRKFARWKGQEGTEVCVKSVVRIGLQFEPPYVGCYVRRLKLKSY